MLCKHNSNIQYLLWLWWISFIYKKKGVILPIFRIKSTKEKCSDTVDVPAMTLTECGCDN